MNIAKLISFAIVAVTFAPAQTPAGATNQIIQVPADWSRRDVGPGTMLTPNSAAANSVVVVLQGFSMGNGLRAAFDQEFVNITKGQRVLSTGQLQNQRSKQGADMLGTTVELQTANGSHTFCYLLGAGTPGSMEVLLLVTGSTQLFNRYFPDVKQLIETRQFANMETSSASPGGASPAPYAPLTQLQNANGAFDPLAGGINPSPPSGNMPDRLEGIYSGFKFVYATTIGAVVQRSARTDFFAFFADGTVFNGLPDHGLVGFNMARACQGRQDFCGIYRVNGDRITIVLNRGTYTQTGTLTPGKIEIKDRSYILQGDPGKTPTHALDGVYGRADARPGEDLARRFIRFTRDGRFQDQGLVTTIAGNEIVNGNLHFEREGGVGTYRLMNFTLILHYSDGYERGLPILIRPEEQDQPMPAGLSINTYTVVRR